jgi:hypothetical protein
MGGILPARRGASGFLPPEHPGRERRHRSSHGLRDRQGALAHQHYPDRRHEGQARVHVPRASARQGVGPARRRLGRGRCGVGTRRATAPVQRQRSGPHPRRGARADPQPRRAGSGLAAGVLRRCGQRALARLGAAHVDGQGVPRCHLSAPRAARMVRGCRREPRAVATDQLRRLLVATWVARRRASR